MNLIILGPQGSGKGTQAKLLAKKLGLRHISTGDLLRQAAKEPTPKGKIIKNLLAKGTLIPFETTLQVLEPVLKKATPGFILDGMPRDLRQAEHLDWILKKIKQKINQVIFITLSKKSSYARLLKRAEIEGRSDDTKEAIKKRLEIYHKETKPVINHYQKQGLVIKIDGEPDITTIHQDILKKISHRTALAA
jgi:adenylate kinase